MEEKTKDKKEKKEPKVVVFGNEVGENENDECCSDEKFGRHFHYHKHRHHGSLAFGLLFILIGLWFLSANLGILPPDVWYQVSRLWPILIVLIGFDILIGHSFISDIIYSLVGILIALTIAGIVIIHTSPQALNGMPSNITNYLYSINNYLQIR